MPDVRRIAQDLPTSRAVAANLRALRRQRGLSMRALAARTTATACPVGANTIQRTERSAEPGTLPVAVSVDQLLALAAALEVSPARLMLAPACPACTDLPPAGFTCSRCGASQGTEGTSR